MKERQQQQHWHYDSQRYGVVDPPTGSYPVDAAVGATLTAMPATSPSYSIPIPIVSQHPSVAGGQQPQYYYGIMDSDGGRGGGGGANYDSGDANNGGMPYLGIRSCPPTNAPLSSSFGRRPRAVSDFIISDYQSSSPRLRQSEGNSVHAGGGTIGGDGGAGGGGGGNRRVMSGLSLAMMNQEDHGSVGVEQQSSHPPPPPADEYADDHHEGLSVLPFGSPATRRAAFHTPPPMLTPDEEREENYHDQQQRARSYTGGEGGGHFFQRHGGYGYGYNNGSNVQFGEERPHPPPPSPQQPDPMKADCGRVVAGPHGPSDVYVNASRTGSAGSLTRPMSTTPPLPTITSRSRSGSISRSGSVGTPPTSALLSGSRHPYNPLLVSGSPKVASLAESKSGVVDVQQRSTNKHYRSTSSSSSVAQLSALLPPITLLDMLQKSPFAIATGRKSATAKEESSHRSFGGSLLGSQHRPRQDEMAVFLNSIPRMVPSSSSSLERNNSSIGAISTLCGEGSSINPTMPSGCDGDDINKSDAVACRSSSVMQTELEDLPFAADDDDAPLASKLAAAGSSTATTSPILPPKSLVASRSLWGSTLDGTIGGGGVGGMAEIASSLAVSSLHHRCATDGKIRLKMFEGSIDAARPGVMFGSPVTGGVAAAGKGSHGSSSLARSSAAGVNVYGDGDPSPDIASIQDQLSNFRSFGASLMVGSSHRENSQ